MDSTGIKQLLFELENRSSLRACCDENKLSHNVFRVLEIETNEVLICRFLGYLLNLKLSKDDQKSPMSLFLSEVLEVDDDAASDAYAELEEVIDDRRRVDIVIRSGQHIYPIEVKIWAGDQEAQLYDYYNYYFKNACGKNNKIYYLTPTGWAPPESSRGGLRVDQEIQRLSFENEIARWLSMINVSADLQSLIIQFKEVIKELTMQSTIIKNTLEAVGLREGFPSKAKSRLEALITLLDANGDRNSVLQREIQKKYLYKYLKFDPLLYTLDDNAEKEERKKLDSHALLYIRKNCESRQIIAWVCIHENLYLGWYDSNGNQQWKYIYPKTYVEKAHSEKFRLDNCVNVLKYEEDIDIGNSLSVL